MIRKIMWTAYLLFVIIGCSENQLLVPEEPTKSVNSYEMLKLPVSKSSPKVSSSLSISKSINGLKGGEIEFEFQLSGTEEVEIKGKLLIPAGAFSSTETIEIIFDNEYALVDFYPSPFQFSLPLELTLIYDGVDIEGISADELDFYYVNDYMNFVELINHDEKVLNESENLIKIVNAELNHFSRYGWLK